MCCRSLPNTALQSANVSASPGLEYGLGQHNRKQGERDLGEEIESQVKVPSGETLLESFRTRYN